MPHRAAALWLEAEVLSLVTAWPATGAPAQQRLDGWTEMWDAAAPVRISLSDAAAPVGIYSSDFVAQAEGIPMDPALGLDWTANQDLTRPTTADNDRRLQAVTRSASPAPALAGRALNGKH